VLLWVSARRCAVLPGSLGGRGSAGGCATSATRGVQALAAADAAPWQSRHSSPEHRTAARSRTAARVKPLEQPKPRPAIAMQASLSSRRVARGQEARPAAAARNPIARPARRQVLVRAEAPAAEPAKPVGTEKTGPNFAALRDINQIMATLPHRCVILAVFGGRKARGGLRQQWQAAPVRRGGRGCNSAGSAAGLASSERPATPATLRLYSWGELGLELSALRQRPRHPRRRRRPREQHRTPSPHRPRRDPHARLCNSPASTSSNAAPLLAWPWPPRYPFLLVDRVVEWEKEKYAVGYKCVTINDNFFPGHFPERPIMPGEPRAPSPGAQSPRIRLASPRSL
jgi:hypothetical protein